MRGEPITQNWMCELNLGFIPALFAVRITEAATIHMVHMMEFLWPRVEQRKLKLAKNLKNKKNTHKKKQSKTESPKKHLDRKSHQKKQKRTRKKHTKKKHQNLHFHQFLLFFWFFSCVSCFSCWRVVFFLFFLVFFIDFGFLVCFFCQTLYSLCCWGHNAICLFVS